MENRIDILNELKELSPVIAGLEKVNVFSVPQGYFEYLSTDVMTGIEIEMGLQNNTSSAENIPLGYFDSLAETVLQKIKAQYSEDALAELRALSPMLYSIQNENIYTVPGGYFENLVADVLDKVLPTQTKVVVMKKRSSVFLKYAVAAVFTGIMALGVFKFTGTPAKTELPDYVAQGLKIQNVDDELAKVTDTEIIKFLEANGSDVDAALIANSIDENELPSQEDYFMDDKALDKYLNSINVNDLKN